MTKLIHLTVCLFVAIIAMTWPSLSEEARTHEQVTGVASVQRSANANDADHDGEPSSARSEVPPLANQIPADTLVYVGWSGMDAIRGQARQSPLSDLWTNELTANIVHVLPHVLNYVNSENPRMAKQIQGLWKIALGLRDYPTGFYFAGMVREKDGLPYPQLGFISRVRDDTEAAMARLSFVDQLGRDLDLPIQVQTRDGIVRASLGGTPSVGKTLADRAEFKSLTNYQTNTPAIWVYVNVARLPMVVEQSAHQALPRFAGIAADRWRACKALLALDQVEGFLWSAGFEDGRWVTRGNLVAPAPRHGWSHELDTQPIADELLRAVPATASPVGAFQVRPGIGVPALEGFLKRADASAAKRLDEGNRLAKAVLGADPRVQLTTSLGNQWAYYCDQSIGGRGLDGLLFVNALHNANGFKTWLPPIMALLKPDPASGTNGIHTQQWDTDGLTLWRIELSGSAVVLGVCENYLLVSRRMETVMAAGESIRKAGSSILDRDEFQAMRKRLGAGAAGAFWYADLRQSTSVPQLVWSAVDALYRTAARAVPFNAPALPSPWKPLSRHLGPAGAFVWTDDRGWHLVTSSPFPGAALMTEPMVLLAPATLAAEPVIDTVHSLRALRAPVARTSPR